MDLKVRTLTSMFKLVLLKHDRAYLTMDSEESILFVITKCNTVIKNSVLCKACKYIRDITNKTYLENANLFRKYASKYCEEYFEKRKKL